MLGIRTFGQKLGAGFALTVAFAVIIGVIAIATLRSVLARQEQIIAVEAKALIDVQKLNVAQESLSTAARGYLLTGDEQFLNRLREARSEFDRMFGTIRKGLSSSSYEPQLNEIARRAAELQAAMDRVIAQRKTAPAIEVSRAFETDILPSRRALDAAIDRLSQSVESEFGRQRERSLNSAHTATLLLWGIIVIAILVAAATAFFLSRALSGHVAGAIASVQSSSAELQAAANQQATGAREHATAMSEIATTIGELLATSRQIAESAQRVARVAQDTTAAARAGDVPLEKAFESITGSRQQIDLVVQHMLDLGRKSQQIGSVLEIVSELAEQTNILAINATIESAGAGEAGLRFGAVADEIRKLADRVAGSTKEIRTLIEEVRGAVNTTVMATESGSKAVDAGAKQFGEVASSFKQIVELISTTSEAAREIELSTKQQSTAVEQVNVAISNISQVTKETEASAVQTLQTASQLEELSRGLVQLIRKQPRS